MKKETYDKISKIILLSSLASASEIPYNTLKSWVARKLKTGFSTSHRTNLELEASYTSRIRLGVVRIIQQLAIAAEIKVEIDEDVLNALEVRSIKNMYKVIVVNDPASPAAANRIKEIADNFNLKFLKSTSKICKEYHFEGVKVSVMQFKQAIKDLKDEEIFLDVSGNHVPILRDLYDR